MAKKSKGKGKKGKKLGYNPEKASHVWVHGYDVSGYHVKGHARKKRKK